MGYSYFEKRVKRMRKKSEKKSKRLKAAKAVSSTSKRLKAAEIVSSFSGKISTGRFENEQPFFSIKEVWDNIDDNFLQQRQRELYEMCRARFSEHEKRSVVERIQQEYQHLRFYETNKEHYPSVTSIINWDKDFFLAKEELIQYAARGTIIHRQSEKYLIDGQWAGPEELPDIYPEYVTMSKGSLGLTLEGYNFPAFCEKYPFKAIDTEEIVYNHEYKYAGRCDIKGEWENQKAVMDIKTGQIDKELYLKQLSAYAKAEGNEDVKLMVIIPLNNKTKQGFSSPIISADIDKYFEMFKRDRKLFKQRFGV